jgi:hypothetical protein
MKVHSATCSCSVELYKLWYPLADFFPNWNFPGVFSTYHYSLTSEPSGKIHPHTVIFLRGLFLILFAGRISEAAMGRTGVGVGGHNMIMINMTIRELYYAFAAFLISLYNINFAERNNEAAMGGGGGRMYFLGCSVAQLGSSVAQ